ncbi:tubulin delta chain [Solea senegalensis]|uniref:Tubulin delta chain n=1 Tax=Solea senegalensis TaxID=28829 RepID=A0AAV6PXL2_SOLSE|nr:tubulin delta chain [Solea senegalensis]KAG7479794.1 tubulin delta chain [Solea senegalensis]
MSVVTLQLGQCGNQVGQELYDVICSDAQDAQRRTTHTTVSCERFFHQNKHGDLVARAVLIDMEPKVIKQSMKKAADSGRWRYGDDSHFSQKQGSGNNWANGFCVHGPRHIEVVEELVRREVERCDRLAGFMTMMSVAGGTGSGVGTYVTQSLRDAYSKSFILNHLTWPYGTGEVIVQNYNSVLTLAHLYQLSDAILVHENDTVHRICSQLLNIKHISFSDVNRVIAHQLGSVLQPALTADSHGVYSRNPLGEGNAHRQARTRWWRLFRACTTKAIFTEQLSSLDSWSVEPFLHVQYIPYSHNLFPVSRQNGIKSLCH